MPSKITLLHGNNREIMKTFADNTFDAIVTDPPYELGFMGRSWDSSGIAYDPHVWTQALRILKPGGHLLAFGGSRTYHRLASAIEDAGFEIRDMLEWLYGTGLPKSLDISKAIDKSKGAKRARNVIPEKRSTLHGDRPWMNDPNHRFESREAATAEAAEWNGYGTALKPAHEPICLARKPLIGTVAQNILTHRTGGLNLDACRIGTEKITTQEKRKGESFSSIGEGGFPNGCPARTHTGRFPANLILDKTAAALLDQQSGQLTSGQPCGRRHAKNKIYGQYQGGIPVTGFGDTGGASRFFYTAKASGADRGHTTKSALPLFGTPEETFRNTHPTVKPQALMTWLLKLVCPPGAHILDPFAGSGSTLLAAKNLGLDCTGIELEAPHITIIEERLGIKAQPRPA